jgi:hypothetical protein
MKVGMALELLAASDDADEHLRKLFEWQFERAMIVVRVLFAVAGSLVLALIAALSKTDEDVGTAQIVIIAVGIVVSFGFGWIRLRRGRRSDSDYIAALELLRLFRPLTGLLRLYRL